MDTLLRSLVRQPAKSLDMSEGYTSGRRTNLEIIPFTPDDDAITILKWSETILGQTERVTHAMLREGLPETGVLSAQLIEVKDSSIQAYDEHPLYAIPEEHHCTSPFHYIRTHVDHAELFKSRRMLMYSCTVLNVDLADVCIMHVPADFQFTSEHICVTITSCGEIAWVGSAELCFGLSRHILCLRNQSCALK
jgi:hypothetical protein